MKKISFHELCNIFSKHNEENEVKGFFEDENAIEAVIVFTKDSFRDDYTEKERSYKVQSDNKFFLPGYCSNSLFGNCLDGNDDMVRLDWYMGADRPWIPEYCYILEKAVC